MKSSTYLKRPDWLTDEMIEKMRKDIKDCSNPYTDEDVKELELDGVIDFQRLNARHALRVLGKYRLLED